MKYLFILLIAVIAITFISANCTGPSVVYTGGVQHQDTIFIVTQPGLLYEVRVIPKLSNLSEEQAKNLVPYIYTTEGVLGIPFKDSDGGSYLFGPTKSEQDTIHKRAITIIMLDGSKVTTTCDDRYGNFQIECGDQIIYIPCIGDSVYDCNNF